jgi:hypothetical protein
MAAAELRHRPDRMMRPERSWRRLQDMRSIAIGVVVSGARFGRAGGRVALLPARVAGRIPAVARAADSLAQDGRDAVDDARRTMEELMVRALTAPEVEQVAVHVLDVMDLDRVVDAVLSDPRTERLVVRVLESRLLDDLTERVLASPELQRIVEHVAASPEVRAAVTQQTEGLAHDVVVDVRRRSENADDAVERRVRGWLHRPRPATS